MINTTFDLWGHALTDLQGKHRPANDADDSLKYFGYWTDNGADDYYNYDQQRGYAGTLEALVARYREEKIPIRHLLLDSWWYHKTRTDYEGKVGTAKNPKLPDGDWNCYGGLLDYTASPFLFAQGLAHFQQTISLPLITHNRWIDPSSPYYERFKISGLAAVDPKFWDQIAAYLKESGVVTYEQDWLSSIFEHSPELSSTPDLGNAFLDNMAAPRRPRARRYNIAWRRRAASCKAASTTIFPPSVPPTTASFPSGTIASSTPRVLPPRLGCGRGPTCS